MRLPFENFKKIFSDVEFTEEFGNENEPKYHILCFKDSGVRGRYVTVDSHKGGEPVNIMFITDIHLNRISQADLDEANPAVLGSIEGRKWCSNEFSLPMLKNSMQYADRFDALVLGGDNIDYLTHGSIDCLEENVFNVYKKPLMAVLGGHDFLRAMETPVKDPDPSSVRPMLQNRWIHDISYHSFVLGDKVMLIGLEGNMWYREGQKEKLEADIERARKENLVILIFQHEPIATNDPLKPETKPFDCQADTPLDNYHGIGGKTDENKPISREVYNLITSNADIIKGIFCGHEHLDYYMEVKATYKQGDKTVDTFIPQYVQRCNVYNKGSVLAITVE